ncbi:MAG TPA: PQQ-binding-like beta-propeller repeat protein [Burkholderiales bacterium]|jgi:alcohol dehydrogenase (cytochrome c)|nr:PQQ-binding-like beta-propeller repeat protein [Burkholderiales bacterium]
MRQCKRQSIGLAAATLAGVSAFALGAAAFAADYKMTVNADRLLNSQNEPHNWLMMNGDYGATRYSKLSQINRESVKNLRLVWALALGGMQDVGQNGPESEVNPLIDNGYMYTTDGWGTIYKIDARSPDKGEFVWITDPGVPHKGNVPRSRGIALWEELVIANLPDGRVIAINRDNGEIVWDKKILITNEFGSREKFFAAPITADGKVIIANGAGDGKTRGWIAALDVRTGNELWRWYAVPKPGDPGSETWKDKNNAWKTGGAGLWQTGSYDPVTKLTIWGTGNPIPQYDPQARPGDNLYTNSAVAVNVDSGKLAWYFQYTPNDSWDYDEVGIHMLHDTTVNGQTRKVVTHFARNGFFYTLDRTNGKFIKAEKYVNDLNWTKGINSKTGMPLEYDPKLDVQVYNPAARSLRGDGMKRTCPTWHGGIAHQPTAYNPVKKIAYGAGVEGCFTQNGAMVAFRSPAGGIDDKASEKRTYTSDLYYGSITAFDTVNHKVIAKAVTDIEIRSGTIATAGGLVFTALQDGWVIAYNDETLEELWRFNVGSPLKGSPVTYAIGPKQYIAVQTSGRHLHPVKYDKLENSSYLFVFALN